MCSQGSVRVGQTMHVGRNGRSVRREVFQPHEIRRGLQPGHPPRNSAVVVVLAVAAHNQTARRVPDAQTVDHRHGIVRTFLDAADRPRGRSVIAINVGRGYGSYGSAFAIVYRSANHIARNHRRIVSRVNSHFRLVYNTTFSKCYVQYIDRIVSKTNVTNNVFLITVFDNCENRTILFCVVFIQHNAIFE